MNDVRPSYHSGFARTAAESERPELWRGLAGAWVPLLGMTGGRLIDVSGRGNHGAAAGSPTWSVGRYGPAMTFNGSSQYASVGTMGDFGSRMGQGVAVEAWIATTYTAAYRCVIGVIGNITSSWLQVFINCNISSATLAGSLLVMTGSGSGRFRASNNADSGACDGKWHHIVACSNPATQQAAIYLDGKPLSVTTSNSGTFSAANFAYPLYVGACEYYSTSANPYWYFPGSIGLMNMYNRFLTASEVRDKYADPLAMFRPRRRVYGGSGPKPIYVIRRRQLQGEAS